MSSPVREWKAREEAMARPVEQRSTTTSERTSSFVAELIDAPPRLGPGEEHRCTLRVRNIGNQVDQLTLEPLPHGVPWIEVPREVHLMPRDGSGTGRVGDDLAEIPVLLRPPRATSPPAGPYAWGMHITSAATTERGVVEAVAVVAPFGSIELSMRRRRDRRSGAEFAVSAVNTGNSPTEVELVGVDASETLRFEARPSRLTLEPGGTANARLQVRGDQQAVTGTAWGTPFSVQARGPDRSVLAEQHSVLRQRPGIGTKGKFLIRLVLTILGVGAMLWAAFLPWISSPELIRGVELSYLDYGALAFEASGSNPTVLSDENFDLLTSAGFVLIILSAVAVAGIATKRGKLTGSVGVIVLVLLIALVVTNELAATASDPPSLGRGIAVAVVGAVLAVGAAIVGSRQSP
jgi:hypothetical protein